MAGEALEQVRLVRRAQRDLDRLSSEERARLVEDILRLASRTFPGEVKKIAALPGKPFQADAGRFRILHVWEGPIVWVLAVFPRSQQGQVFRSLRRNPGA